MYYVWLTDRHRSFGKPDDSLEKASEVLVKNHIPMSEHEGDIRKYRASYGIYLRSSSKDENSTRDPTRFIGRIGAKELGDYGPPFPEHLTMPQHILERKEMLMLEVGYSLLEKAWGNGYAPEALKALTDALRNTEGFWSPPYKKIYLLAIVGEGNERSVSVIKKCGFELNGVHKWDAPDVFIGGAMRPCQVSIFSLGSAGEKVAECNQ